jgi:hypothetical protein
MKGKITIYLIIFLFCFFNPAAFPDTKHEFLNLFYSANGLYEKGKYEEAANEYNKILEMGLQSGPLYYNLGNTYFKLGMLGKTILFYEKAKRQNPRDPELRFNYNYVQSLLKDKIETEKKGWVLRNIEKLSEFMTLGRWLGWAVSLWIVLIGLIISAILFPKTKRLVKYVEIIVAVFLLVVVICVFVNYNVYSSPSAVVLPKEVIVRYGPGEDEVEAFLLHEGTKVEVLREEGEWRQIRLPDEKTGWLSKDTISMI